MQNEILILDNYDSFTYNLVQMIEQITGKSPAVYKNDEIALQEVEKFDTIILSPGPGTPSEAGNMLEVIRNLSSAKRILGICLGHQAIAEAFGGKLYQLNHIFHGVASAASRIAPDLLLDHLPETIEVGRYHSWAVDPESMPPELVVTSQDEYGTVMSLRHNKFEIYGLQYHPESILTPFGRQILENFFEIRN